MNFPEVDDSNGQNSKTGLNLCMKFVWNKLPVLVEHLFQSPNDNVYIHSAVSCIVADQSHSKSPVWEKVWSSIFTLVGSVLPVHVSEP